MRSGQKIAVSLVAGFAVLSLLVVFSILALLPNPSWVGDRLDSLSQLNSPPRSNAPTDTAPIAPALSTIENVNKLTTNSTPAATMPEAERRRLVFEKFIDRYLREDRIQTAVCENLGNATAPFRSTEEFGRQIESSLLGESKPSAATEAIMLPIEYTLKNEAVRELIQSAKNAADRGDTGFVQKAQFYTQAALATASVLSSREEFETISGHAYRLYAISRAAALHPEILQDPDTGDLCRGIERSALDGVSRDIAFDQERLMRLLGRHGIDPASIDYNPETSTRLRVVSNRGSVQIQIPWLDQVFKSRR